MQRRVNAASSSSPSLQYTCGTTVQRREMEQITECPRARQEDYEAMELRSVQKRGRLPMESVY